MSFLRHTAKKALWGYLKRHGDHIYSIYSNTNTSKHAIYGEDMEAYT